MLTRILDTTEIDINNPDIKSELEMDLRRMDSLSHEERPEGVNSYKVIVTPSVKKYTSGLHRFRFEIQYGKLNKKKFEPKGDSVWYQTETLPMI